MSDLISRCSYHLSVTVGKMNTNVAFSSVIPCLTVQGKCILPSWDIENIDEKARETNANAPEHHIKD